MIKQKSFNYIFNSNDNEFNFFVNQTNFYAFNALINNENKDVVLKHLLDTTKVNQP